MSFMLTRMLAYFTLFSYLVVGSFAVRILAPEMTEISFTNSYSKLFKNAEFEAKRSENFIEVPKLQFAEIKFEEVKPRVKVAKVIKKAPKLNYEEIAQVLLNFDEPVKLKPIHFEFELQENLLALFNDFTFKETLVAEVAPINEEVQDSVSTVMASSEEPEFFEYETVVADVPNEVPTKEEIAEYKNETINPANAEEVSLNDLISFDYSQAKEDLKEQAPAAVSVVTTQNKKTVEVKKETPKKKVLKKVAMSADQNEFMEKNNLMGLDEVKTFHNSMTIQVTGSDLNELRDEAGFEIRFQDDLSETYQDYNNGSISLDTQIANRSMTRSAVVMKHGYAPTNIEIILEDGSADITVPLIVSETFNELLSPYESKGPMGAVLIELAEEVKSVNIDVPHIKVINLNRDLAPTPHEDYVYQLFVGAIAGNALLTYETHQGETYQKIIHIHERELFFDSFITENIGKASIELFEEGLLSKEKSALVLSSENVLEFPQNAPLEKINGHTYKNNFTNVLLGSRKYLELTHQSEPVFIGHRENAKIEVPTESFMRFILSKFEGRGLSQRCLIQVNLNRIAKNIEVASESVQQAVMTKVQVLDTDGKFYDSLDEKSTKVIILGENHGSGELNMDSKVNIKITYLDGSHEFLGSYCSPNTYLVEQL